MPKRMVHSNILYNDSETEGIFELHAGAGL
jgi:hypothetical protein